MSQPTVLKDRSGVPFYYGDGGRVWFPPFPLPHSYVKQLDVIKDGIIRSDDVIMTGYGKSGSHWHYEMLSMLQRGKAQYVKQDKPTEMIDKLTKEETDALPSPRVLNTHVPFDLLPREALEKKTKVVYLLRNPKDVAVSMYNHVSDWQMMGYSGTWPDFLHMFLYTGVWGNLWFDSVREWERDIQANPDHPVYIAAYEKALRDPVGHVMKLNDFLGLGRSRELCQQIADLCSFAKLKEAARTEKDDQFKGVWKKGSPGFYRKGIVGDWANWFTAEQNEEFDRVYQDKMADSKLNIIFQL